MVDMTLDTECLFKVFCNYSALLNFAFKRLCTLSEVEVLLSNTSTSLGKQEHGLRAVIQELTEKLLFYIIKLEGDLHRYFRSKD